MSKRVDEFIDKLENGFPPMEHGYIVYEGGFFSSSVWYRFDLEADVWQWTDDLIYWYSVSENRPNVSTDNLLIINYLRLKSLNKSIKGMTKNLEDTRELEQIVHNLFINYKTLEKISIDQKYTDDVKIQDYQHQIDHEFKELDRLLASVLQLENNFEKDRESAKTRISQRAVLAQYTANIMREKMLVIEQRFKISYLMNGLKERLLEICVPDNLLETYKTEQLEDDLNQVCNFLNKKALFIDNNRVHSSVFNYQAKILNSLGISVNQNLAMNSEFIMYGINGLKSKNEKLNSIILDNNQKINDLESINDEMSEKIKTFDNSDKKLKTLEDELTSYDNNNRELCQQINELLSLNNINNKKIKDLELQLGKAESAKTDLGFQLYELESFISYKESEIYQLRSDNGILHKDNNQLKNTNGELKSENEKLKEQLDKILSLCPQVIYDNLEKVYVLKEDTYDLLEDD